MPGLETRDNILPIPKIPEAPEIFGPDYSFVEQIPLPGNIGVRDGDRLADVIDSVKASAYYMDMIGFGEPSNIFTRNMNPKPKALGINFWMKSGMTCSNGAEMWNYVPGIPQGDVFGDRIKDSLKGAGLPALRGLAPGMGEDVKVAMDPRPMMSAVFGSAYPECKYEVREVGDQDGNIINPATGKPYMPDFATAVKNDQGQFVQGRWVYSRGLPKSEWEKALKEYCPDGYRKKNHRNFDCKGPIKNLNEKFVSYNSTDKTLKNQILVGVATIGCLLILKGMCKRDS